MNLDACFLLLLSAPTPTGPVLKPGECPSFYGGGFFGLFEEVGVSGTRPPQSSLTADLGNLPLCPSAGWKAGPGDRDTSHSRPHSRPSPPANPAQPPPLGPRSCSDVAFAPLRP